MRAKEMMKRAERIRIRKKGREGSIISERKGWKRKGSAQEPLNEFRQESAVPHIHRREDDRVLYIYIYTYIYNIYLCVCVCIDENEKEGLVDITLDP